jgi:hypothetical protein
MADLARVAAEVGTFADALAQLAQRLAAVEAALGLPRAADDPADEPAVPDDGSAAASDADVARLQIVLATYADARASLEGRVATLEQALAAFAPGLPPARIVAVTGSEPIAGGTSRAALDRLQKRTVTFAATLAGLELRVAAAEDALDAFFGTAR